MIYGQKLMMHAADLYPMPLTDPFDLEHNLGRTATQRCTLLRSPGACADR